MALSLASLSRSGGKSKPPRILVYGVQGIGKTTFGADAPNPVVIPIEDGLGKLDVPSFPIIKSIEEFFEAVTALYEDGHNFKTVIIDSMDWLEPLVWDKVCRDNNWKSIEDPGFGKGYVAATNEWRRIFEAVDGLRDLKGMNIVMIAHSQIKRFDSPEHDPYDRYEIKLHKAAGALCEEHADVVLFLNYQVSTIKADGGFNKKTTRAVGSGNRMAYAQERPAFRAKNRYGLPESFKLDDAWMVLAPHVSLPDETKPETTTEAEAA